MLGIDKALGHAFAGQLALWQVLARVLDQGSGLSGVRLAQVHAACDVLGIRRGFDENDLYANLTWLSDHQPAIEQRLFAARRGQHKPELFLYDVTSSYLEGEQNACGAYGYDRDGKKGKKQIVIGLLLEAGVLQMDLFDAAVCEVQQEGLRYVLRRNPLRAEQLAASRTDKQARLERLRADRNRYLAEHPRAKVEGGGSCLRIPTPAAGSRALLKALDILSSYLLNTTLRREMKKCRIGDISTA
ncbi:MAG: hypothetical protein AAB225_31375 [Acidobacteriota bacterium]